MEKNLVEMEKGKLLQETVKDIVSKAANLNKYAFDVARQLSMIKEKKLWQYEDVTQPYKGFEHWYEYSGIPVKWETARQWIRTYSELIVKLGYTPEQLADIDFYKLRLVCSVALRDPSKVPATLEQAKVLSYRDLFLAIKQAGMDIEACTHPEVEEITSYKCKVCHQTFRNKI